MSQKYDEYIRDHKANVMQGYEWIRQNFPELVTGEHDFDYEYLLGEHDKSKFDLEEYDAYDKYFYGGNRSYMVVQDFNRAWLHHIHDNPHHWQHWVLINDEEKEGTIILDMPYQYIIEMICDWWSFSWKTGKLTEIFDWYDAHKNMKLSSKTREIVEDILDKIRVKLQESECQTNG